MGRKHKHDLAVGPRAAITQRALFSLNQIMISLAIFSSLPSSPEVHYDAQYLALLNSPLSKHVTNVSELFLQFSGAKQYGKPNKMTRWSGTIAKNIQDFVLHFTLKSSPVMMETVMYMIMKINCIMLEMMMMVIMIVEAMVMECMPATISAGDPASLVTLHPSLPPSSLSYNTHFRSIVTITIILTLRVQ